MQESIAGVLLERFEGENASRKSEMNQREYDAQKYP